MIENAKWHKPLRELMREGLGFEKLEARYFFHAYSFFYLFCELQSSEIEVWARHRGGVGGLGDGVGGLGFKKLEPKLFLVTE